MAKSNNIQHNESDYLADNSLFFDDEEGGLNLVEFKETLLRRIPLIASFTIFTASLALIKAIVSPPIYSAGFEILSEPVAIETRVTSSTDANSQDTREEIATVELDEVQLKILKSPKLILRVVDALQSEYPLLNYKTIVEDLNIETNETQNVLLVNYQHENRQQVLDVLNTLSQVYLDYSIEKRQSGVKRGIEFLEKQLPLARTRVEEFQKQLQELTQKYNFINPEVQANQLAARLESAIEEYQQVEAELKAKQVVSENLVEELSQQPTTSTTAMDVGTTRHQELLRELREIDSEIARKSVIFSDRSHQMQTLQEQRAEIVGLITMEGETDRQKVSNQLEALQSKQVDIQARIDNLQEQIEQWSIIASEYNNIRQQLNIATNKLNGFVAQRDALSIDAAQREAPWQLLTLAGEPQANTASAINYLVLGATLGLFIGVGTALVLDKYGNKIYTHAQVRQIANLPVLGMIPHDPTSGKKSFLTEEKKRIAAIATGENTVESELQIYRQNNALLELISPSVEAFRTFAANLGLFDADNLIQSFIITSAIAGEGKTTVTFNLAKAVANVGRRVLVIDADLRSEDRLTNKIGLSQANGLTNFLLEPDADWRSFIQPSPVEENLYILTSGNARTSLEPSRLLTSSKMQTLCEQLKVDFDLIVYDMPPTIGYADVSLLKANTDGVVLVTGLGKVDSFKLKEALNQLSLSRTNILGIVVNELN